MSEASREGSVASPNLLADNGDLAADLAQLDEAARAVFDLEPEALRCPVTTFQRMGELEPVHYIPELDMYFVTTHAMILDAVRRTEDFSNEKAAHLEVEIVDDEVSRVVSAEGDDRLKRLYATTNPYVLLRADPPVHSRQRTLVRSGFTPRRVMTLEPQVQGIVDELLDTLVPQRRFDARNDFASPMSIRVITRSLRCSDDDVPQLIHWADEVAASHTGTRLDPERVTELAKSRIAFARFFLEKIDDARANPGPDLLSGVVNGHLEDEEAPLSDDELLYMFEQFLVAGTETTSTTFGNGLVILSSRPELTDRLRSDPEQIPMFWEEVLRWDPPTRHIYRTATRDTELGGVAIPAGARVVLYWAAGSRDASVFDDPNAFRATRERNTHLAFGHGAHFCVGAPLARVELRIALEGLLRRTTSLRLATDESELERHANALLQSFTRIPVEVEPAATDA